MSSPSLLAYRLAAPDTYTGRQPDLQRMLFGSAGGGILAVSPVSGCFSYYDDAQLWSPADRSPTVDLDRAARAFMLRANSAIGSLSKNGNNRLPPLFPTEVRPVEKSAVFGLDRETIAHWLIRYQPLLPTGVLGADRLDTPTLDPAAAQSPTSPTAATLAANPAESASGLLGVDWEGSGQVLAPVLGGTIDIRLGSDGAVQGVRSTWRPVTSQFLVPVIPPHAEAGEDPDGRQEGPPLVYVAAGPGEPQTILGPYYLHAGGEHGGTIEPASRSSLTVAIAQQLEGEAVRLSAVVEGSSTKVAYAWACWRLDTPDLKLIDLGTAAETVVSNGLFNVIMDVRDDVSGAIARCEAIVKAATVRERP
jgi:hypothetical protein